ncbi:hypothetical protein [Chromobacterium phragmitis]|uniref:hypothetical protein n=1 Tax=Chromobacterium phragmitis TaxID=2202141 RepID=UPI0011AEC332|nr:hypothetical protein [Chromobacterium phragmitis]
MKKTTVLFCLCLLSPFSFADEPACLDDLAGIFQSAIGRSAPESVLAVKHGQDGWEFSLPQSSEDNKDSLFRYHFDRAKTLPANALTGDSLQYVGHTMLTPFLEKNIPLDKIKIECGLAVDGMFLLRMDLAQADNRLLKNMAMLSSAMAGDKPSVKISDRQVKKLRGTQYFAGESLQLDGVINTITPFLVQKSANAGQAH